VDGRLSGALAPVLDDLRNSGGPVPGVRDAQWSDFPGSGPSRSCAGYAARRRGRNAPGTWIAGLVTFGAAGLAAALAALLANPPTTYVGTLDPFA
jgi:hypothetical protein